MFSKIIYFSLIIILCLVFFDRLFAQEAKRIIRDIEVQNNKIMSTQAILSKLKIKKGMEFLPSVLSDDIKRLYATGNFSDVSADVVDLADGVKVVINVREKSMLQEIVFKGNKRINKRRLKSRIKIKDWQR